MADGVFNIALGKVKYYAELPAANDALIMILLKATGLVADATLRDYDDVSALLAGATDECDFTNYARKTLTTVTITVDDTNERVDIDCDDVVYTTAGGATNNSVGKAIIVYDPDTTTGTDTTLVPLTFHDMVFTTDGTTQTLQIANFFRAA